MIISGILLFLALAITLTGCNDGEPEPTVTPTPTATAGPTISSTSSATTSSPQEIFEPFPTPDVQPLGPTISGPDPYRVVFLLDNSITPMTKCPEAPEMPDNSRARRLMKETTTFLVNLLAAVNGPTNPGVQIGVYTLYGWNKNDGLGSMTLTPLQPADNYEWDPGWSNTLEQVLKGPGIDEGGYAPAIQRLRADGVLGSDEKQIVILITDGFIGGYSSESAKDKRQSLKDELEALALQENETTFIVLRLKCPGLENDTTYLGTAYDTDVLQWNALSGLNLIEHLTIPLPGSLMIYSSNSLTLAPTRPYAAEITQLLELESFESLLPRLSQGDGTYGWGWKQEGDTRGPHHTLPGDTGIFRLWIALSSSVPGAGYDLIVSREEKLDKAKPRNGTYPGTVQLDDLDGALNDILVESTDTCDPIDWQILGDKSLAFYWWDSTPVNYKFNSTSTQISPPTVTNNGQISVTADVDAIGPVGHRVCYGVRASLYTIHQSEMILLDQDHVQLSEMGDDMRHVFEFTDYIFNPGTDGKLWVTLEISREFDRKRHQTGEIAAVNPTQVDTWSYNIPLIYSPQLGGSSVECEAKGCMVKIQFRYAGLQYHNNEPPQPRLYALSTFEHDELSGPACKGYTDTQPILTFSQGNRDGRFSSIMSLGQTVDGSLEPTDTTWKMERIDNELKQIALEGPFPQEIIDDCGYEGILLQWPGRPDWPDVFCEFAGNGPPDCIESDMRITESQ